MYDLDNYRDNLRGFYLDVHKELPGDIITDEVKLLNNIINNKEYLDKNMNKIIEFNKIYNQLQDGRCCKRVIEKIIK